MYNFIDSEMLVMCDVDDTLVMWGDHPSLPWDLRSYEEQTKVNKEDIVEIEDPYSQGNFYLKKHNKHIKLIQDYKVRGYTVVVWSAGGAAWAKNVVNALGLKDSVDLVMVKPVKFVDDLQANEILGTRVYLSDEN